MLINLLLSYELVGMCKENNIQVEGYSSLARMDERLINDESLNQIAKSHNKEVTQVILRWNFQKGIITIPKSKDYNRQRKNISIFDFSLSEKEILAIDSLNCNVRVRHNPDTVDFSVV